MAANRLRHRLPPTMYDDYCEELLTLEQRDEDFELRDGSQSLGQNRGRRQTPMFVPPTHSNAPTSRTEPMDWQLDVAMVKPSRVMYTQPGPPAPPSNSQRARWVSNQERELCKQRGQCIQWGITNHMIRQCPYLPAVPANNLNSQPRRPTPRVQFMNLNPDLAANHVSGEPVFNCTDTIDMTPEDLPEPSEN